MALKIVGSGLGRTGTKSMQTALGMLGFGPCHHMVEVFMHPESMALWVDAGEGRPDWDLIADHYPDAKVLHTVRDPDKWFDSTQATIFSPASPAVNAAGPQAAFFESFMGSMREHLHDRAWMTDHFRQRTEEVKAAVPPERLLIYEVGEGWDRLCKFLGVPVPAEPYPSENSREEFIARSSAMRAAMAQQPGEQA
jgi:hypothetical protein